VCVCVCVLGGRCRMGLDGAEAEMQLGKRTPTHHSKQLNKAANTHLWGNVRIPQKQTNVE
jgi:hypothetical protein